MLRPKWGDRFETSLGRSCSLTSFPHPCPPQSLPVTRSPPSASRTASLLLIVSSVHLHGGHRALSSAQCDGHASASAPSVCPRPSRGVSAQPARPSTAELASAPPVHVDTHARQCKCFLPPSSCFRWGVPVPLVPCRDCKCAASEKLSTWLCPCRQDVDAALLGVRSISYFLLFIKAF